MNNDIIVIGAGMAGLACATALSQSGHKVRLFDKGRGPGGRMATRRVDQADRQLSFDHGAQYFTATSTAFQSAVARWESTGHVARWPDAGEDAWVGTPGMNAPLKAMAQDLDVTWNARIEMVTRETDHWTLSVDGDVLECGTLLIAIPPEQVATLLDEAAPDLAERARATQSLPCWALMVDFAEAIDADAETFSSEDGPIAWAARNSAKPGRDGKDSWVMHASARLSREILELDKDEAAELLLADFFEQFQLAPQSPSYVTAHRWRYAFPEVKDGPSSIWDEALKLGLAGDWLHSPRVEGAWLSGTSLAETLLKR